MPRLSPHLADKLPSLQAFEDEEARRHFKTFIRMSWPHIEEGTPFLDNWHIDAIAEHLTALYKRQIKRLIINIPPRCMKSSLASVAFPAWVWLQDPSFKMLTCSYERGLAVRDAMKSRKLFDHPWYARINRLSEDTKEPIFRMAGTTPSDRKLKDSEDWYENNRGGVRIALGVESGATGKGGNLIAVDDPQDPTQAHSEVERIKALTWWDGTMSTRLNNPKEDLKMIIMQRLHTFDLTGHAFAKERGYVLLKLPMEFDSRKRCRTVVDGKVWEDPRKLDGDLLWTARFGPEEIAGYRTSLGTYGFAGQMQQEPLPEGGGVFKLDWFKRYNALPVFEVVAMSVDCAFTDADDSSFVVIQIWGFKGPQAYLLDQVRAHLSFTATEQAIRDMRAKWRGLKLTPSAVLIENKANGPAIINRLALEIPGIVMINPKDSKEARAQAVSPFVEAGNVHLPEDVPWMSTFLFEIVNFPRAGTDDQVDAMSQALCWRYLRETDLKVHQKRSRFLDWAGVAVSLTKSAAGRRLGR